MSGTPKLNLPDLDAALSTLSKGSGFVAGLTRKAVQAMSDAGAAAGDAAKAREASAANTTAIAALATRVARLERPPAPPPEPQPSTGYVGSKSSSFIDYPDTGPVTGGTTGTFLYVDPKDGLDTRGGTTASGPLRTMEHAVALARGGNVTVLARGGVYPLAGRLRCIGGSGDIRIFGYGTERPVLDATRSADYAIDIGAGGRWHLKGFEIINSKKQAVSVGEGAHGATIEGVWGHHLGGALATAYIADDLLVLGCVAWDLGDGVSTDTNTPDGVGFGALGSAPCKRGKVVRTVILNAPDDSLDAFRNIGGLFLDNVSFEAGRYANGNRGGDGNGLKLGGGRNPDGGGTIARGNLVIRPRSTGITNNSSIFPNTYDHNTVVDSEGFGYVVDPALGEAAIGNLSIRNHPNITALGNLKSTFNSWDLGITDPQFEDIAAHKYGVRADGPAGKAGPGGTPLGASDVAIALAARYLNDPRFTGAPPA